MIDKILLLTHSIYIAQQPPQERSPNMSNVSTRSIFCKIGICLDDDMNKGTIA